ncbi:MULTISPECIES: hypothetical protein [Pedobacter]|uniref:Uncharacterized protein n=1 Tax=Pedobacter heparinus (strain ATCC 13125 / DSM 2366 / CIP 104194 / JCM 7457 / NBRC 12017 / NCIMB 9290 / NRRL B-14731 / HIM 762-3) TaxID=485917 RepID=C6XZB0_PEDHD|nr:MULTISPECIES: hypothetical protein [Pedobacter]ACU04606.1 hypothetical protein Phep_2402 [Pedobacter heparinus DSM 2366]MBB5437543.1 hypothetical protein [Pedobacter sp. AK017]
MKNHGTPKPGSKQYDVEKTENLTKPKYHSSTDRRSSQELPATENLNDQPENNSDEKIKDTDVPKTNLGNKRDGDEKKM